MSGSTPPWKIWLGMLAIYVFWGSTYLAIRIAVETMPPFLMAAARFLVAGVIIYTWRRLIARDAAPRPVHWRSAAIIGLFLLLGGNGGVVWAETRLSSSIAALVVATTPLWLVVIDALRPKDRILPSRGTVAGVVVGLLGIFILIGPARLFGGTGDLDLYGVVVLLLAAVFWAAGSIYNRGAQLPASPLLGTGMEMLVGGAALLLVATITGEWSQITIATFSTRSLLALAYLVVFGAIIGFSAYTWLLRVAPTPLVSTYAYVNPLIAVLLGYLILDEELNARMLLAAAVIISSVILINTSRLGRYRRRLVISEEVETTT